MPRGLGRAIGTLRRCPSSPRSRWGSRRSTDARSSTTSSTGRTRVGFAVASELRSAGQQIRTRDDCVVVFERLSAQATQRGALAETRRATSVPSSSSLHRARPTSSLGTRRTVTCSTRRSRAPGSCGTKSRTRPPRSRPTVWHPRWTPRGLARSEGSRPITTGRSGSVGSSITSASSGVRSSGCRWVATGRYAPRVAKPGSRASCRGRPCMTGVRGGRLARGPPAIRS